jgi:hypothetical protein
MFSLNHSLVRKELESSKEKQRKRNNPDEKFAK